MEYYIIKVGNRYWRAKDETIIQNKSLATKYDTVDEVLEVADTLKTSERYLKYKISTIKITETEISI